MIALCNHEPTPACSSLTHLLSLGESGFTISGSLVSGLAFLQDRLWDRDRVQDGTIRISCILTCCLCQKDVRIRAVACCDPTNIFDRRDLTIKVSLKQQHLNKPTPFGRRDVEKSPADAGGIT